MERTVEIPSRAAIATRDVAERASRALPLAATDPCSAVDLEWT
jgi:hypothetical protein